MSQASALDLRLPIGGLFTAIGLLVGGYGLATNGDAMYERSLAVNINLWWGLVMLVVGVIMLTMGWRATREHHPASALPAESTPEGLETERREHRKGLEH
jgi:membrane protein implicated in regulation of membrane protease activity